MGSTSSSASKDQAQQAPLPQDSLLACLSYLTRHYGQARSPASIIAGLPYTEKGMGPSLFCEAAKGLGYNTKITQKSLRDIDEATLPLVLVLDGNNAAVLTAINGNGESFELYKPQADKVETISDDELSKVYSGHVILLHPNAQRRGVEPDEKEAVQYKKHWFWGVVMDNRGLYARVCVAAVLINLFALASPLFIMNVYDRVIPNSAIETGWVLGIGALCVLVFDFIMRTLRGYFIDLGGRKIDVIVGQRIYDHVLNMRLEGRPKSSGIFANMLKEFDAVKDFFTSATMVGFVDLPFSLLFIFVIYMLGGPVAYVLLVLMLASIAVGFFLQYPLRYLISKSMKAAEAKHGLLIETIVGLETIKAVRADGRLRARYGEYIGEAASVGQTSRFFSGLGVNIATLLQQSASILIVLAGMYYVRDGQMSVGALIASVILGGRAIAPMTQIAGLLARYHQSRSSLTNLNHIMSLEVERPSDKRFLHRPDLQGKIVMDKVCFSYPETDRQVLDHVSLKIEAGEKIGIIGRIGSGKSTLARLLMGLYQPSEGSILIDDTDYRQIDPADLRRNMGYIAQDVVLFSGSIRHNITISKPNASEEEILAAAKLSGVHDFVSAHPHGYDAQIGERGEGLSGGQRQAVALARAILNQPKIFVCDEPTNAMDTQAEENFIRHIHGHVKDHTLLLITHRHSLLRMVDRLILMDHGRVIADGPRDQVLAALAKNAEEAVKQRQQNAQNQQKDT